ncbi:carbonic anhydrase 1-like [Lutzomyia longipalpis]|uniref:carbonic anhydrase 1-like n=1 Tax=Lutzomyia longipalpis TaxID=7200 RepID=UPI002483A95C|nr:carbonic anhydrase 1-like [Lutzomyia longipalpis]
MWHLTVVLLTTVTNLCFASHWGYPTPRPNGEVIGPENWGGACDTGQKQSPVDLSFKASVRGEFPELLFEDYDEPIVDAKVLNTGHSIQINVGSRPNVVLSGGGLPSEQYVMEQMHFHWGSEHTINGRRYALELHMVHFDSKYPNVQTAVANKDGVAVLGVLFYVSSQANPDLENILNSSRTAKDGVGMSDPLLQPLAPETLLPQIRDSYFRYEGSLTTPSCGEAVIWTVFTQSLPISFDQLERFKTIKTNNGTLLTHNFRTVQPLNARPLVYVAPIDYELENSSSNTMKFSSALAICIFVAYLFA